MTDQLIDPSIEQRDAIEDYYDEYSTWYEGERRDGYYAFVNDLEFEAVRGASTGARVLEIGCGTGLILERTAALAATAVGIDLSAGMASFSRTEKGLTTVQATADQLPFPDDSFDLVYSFKVLPHVPDIQGALREVDRVLAPGGRAFLEFYSPTSLKHLANRASIALTGRTPVYVRYDGLGRIGRLLPAGMAVRSVRGVRILGPTRHLYTAPVLGPAAVRLEGRLSTTALARLGGYLVVEVGRPEVRATAKPRLAVVVKYHPPGQRISGIVGFLTALHRRLAKSWDLHVVSYETEGRGARTVEVAGYQVHRVGFPFPVTSWRKARALRADAVLVVSGINDLRLAAPYFALLSSFSGRRDGVRRAFLQATHVAQRPPAAFTRMLRRYDSVVCAGPAIHDDLAPAAGDRAVLVRPGVDVAVLDAVRPAPKPRRLRYGFVNHLNPRKGADIAVPALARLAADCEDVDVVIAGTGPLQAGLVAGHGADDRITFAGFLEDDERLALMRSCDVMLLPFRTGVGVLGVSQTVLECMAMGVVVVGSRTAAIAPALDAGTDGLLFDDGDEMERQLRQLHDDPGLLARLGAAARHRARRDFDVARTAEELTRLLAPPPVPEVVAARGAT